VVNQEFSKVPQNVGSSILERNFILKVSKDRSGIGTIDIFLGEHNHTFSVAETITDKGCNFFGGTGFLLQELIAGKGKNFESLLSVFINQFDELCVIDGGHTSFGGDIDNAKDIALVLIHGDIGAIDQSIRNAEEFEASRKLCLFSGREPCEGDVQLAEKCHRGIMW
jgi:hypothetical protein